MKRTLTLIPFLLLALVSLACSVSIDLPEDHKTGPTQTQEINVPLPDNTQLVTDLTLSFGGGKLEVNPGASGALVTGVATFNVPDFTPKVTISGNDVKIEQGNLNLRGIPDFDEKVINVWNLQLADVPLDLRIKAGAYSGSYELGGLNLQRLAIADGAADAKLSFSQPNQDELDLFEYSTGASSLTMEGLANANVDTFIFRSGAGNYKLDFSGELQREMTVSIESGMSSITLIIPEGVAAEVRFEGGLSNITPSSAWEKYGDVYRLEGSGPMINIVVKMAAGNLDLRTR